MNISLCRLSAILAGGFLISLTALDAAEAKKPDTRPNILFIIVDQQHAEMLSCAGNPNLKTPAMDSLAASGARFTLSYCADPVCVPSRYSMMTGTMPSRVRMETNEDSNKSKLSPALLQNTMGQIFSKAGYETIYGGKAHFPMSIEDAGFKQYDRKNGTDLAGKGLAKNSVQFIRQPHAKPFLMVSSFINPHDICFMAISSAKKPGTITGPKPMMDAMKIPAGVTREDFFAKLCPPLPANHAIPLGEPESILAADQRGFRVHARNEWSEEEWRMHRWTYARLTETVDTEIGEVLKALKETGLDENTLVVFTSDHGDMDGSHRLEHKSVLYDEASRVPFIVSWKGVTKAGLIDKEHLVSTGLDIIPTLCDFAGIPLPTELKGRSVRALAEGRTPASWRETIVTENGGSRMLRSARYKYVVYATGKRNEMLTDMNEDPGEMKNLALDPAFASVLTEHRRLLKEWYPANGEVLDAKYNIKGN